MSVFMFPELTPRERAVATRILRGETNSEIAEALGISTKTYNTHRAHILKKLEARHNVDLVLEAHRRGYLGML